MLPVAVLMEVVVWDGHLVLLPRGLVIRQVTPLHQVVVVPLLVYAGGGPKGGQAVGGGVLPAPQAPPTPNWVRGLPRLSKGLAGHPLGEQRNRMGPVLHGRESGGGSTCG